MCDRPGVRGRSVPMGDPVRGNWGPADQTEAIISSSQAATNPPRSHTKGMGEGGWC